MTAGGSPERLPEAAPLSPIEVRGDGAVVLHAGPMLRLVATCVRLQLDAEANRGGRPPETAYEVGKILAHAAHVDPPRSDLYPVTRPLHPTPAQSDVWTTTELLAHSPVKRQRTLDLLKLAGVEPVERSKGRKPWTWPAAEAMAALRRPAA